MPKKERRFLNAPPSRCLTRTPKRELQRVAGRCDTPVSIEVALARTRPFVRS
jgi:hypothetical protein